MCNRYNYLGSAFISIILGIIIGVLFNFGLFPNIQTVLIIALVFAVINYILYSVLFLRRNRNENGNGNNNQNEYNTCRCRYSYGIIIGIIGTILFTTFAFGVEFSSGMILTAILIGIVAFFFIFMIINVFLYLMCLNEDCRCDCNCSCNCNCNCNNNTIRSNNEFNYNYTNLNNY